MIGTSPVVWFAYAIMFANGQNMHLPVKLLKVLACKIFANLQPLHQVA